MMSRIRRNSIAVVLTGLAFSMALLQEPLFNDARAGTVHGVANAKGKPVRVGERAEQSRLHCISRPGLYGMGRPPKGSGYGVIDGRLVRYDLRTLQIQSIIRQVDYILD